jgi:hypothetical protein
MEIRADNEKLSTGSRVRAWWLTTFRGFRVDMVTREPKSVSFGKVVYQSRYVLCKRSPNS